MVSDLVRQLALSAPLAPLREGLGRGVMRQWVFGLRGTGQSLGIAAALEACREASAPRVQFILAPSQERAETLFADLAALTGEQEDAALVLFPSLESLLFEETSPDYQLIRERMTVLAGLAAGDAMIIIATPDAALHRTLPPASLREAMRVVRANEMIEPSELASWLTMVGYTREGLVEQPGQFSLRGGVLDVFPSTEHSPVRLEFFGDEIDSMRVFDTADQRSRGNITEVRLYPAREMLLTPERVEAGDAGIREVLKQQLAAVSHEPIRLPGEDGKPEEMLSPAERLSAKIGNELELLAQQHYFNGVEYYLPFLYPEGATLLDYLPDDATVILVEPDHTEESFRRFQDGLAQLEISRLVRGALLPTPHTLYLPLEDGLSRLGQHREVIVSLLAPGIAEQEQFGLQLADLAPVFEVSCQVPSNYSLTPGDLETDLRHWVREGYAVVVATHQEHRMAETIGGIGVPVATGEAAQAGTVSVRRVELGEGIIFPDARLALLTDGELLGWQKQRRTIRRRVPGQAVASVNQLEPGDYVVHINHGIGRYAGLVRREVFGTEREFLEIDYAGSDKLFVPVDQLDRVQKYVTLDDGAPEVHRLGGGEWERIKKRTKRSTEELAKQLLQLQAIRSREPGHAFTPDTPWQREMEEGFPWRETPDQLTAIEAVKWDMEQPHPTDRLICGDVGYGKTEVAIRAAFKAIMDGKQVAVLAPTTVLATQHFRTFRERMAAFPIRVELLSRSVSRRDQTRIIADVAGGAVDLVIGTHRILSKDVKYKELGLVIVDEEQRFGVKQKEKMKEFNPGVDMLTMSATPIPRTLHMALSGLREMSLINTPPEGRMPVRTLALEADDEVLREAILRELDRDGQVFILHNRISSIYHIAEHIHQVVPQARVEVAHGQMVEGELDRIMVEFYERSFDVLVCTAIIENGVDFPNVNTLIVDEADKFGLAQLYQLRGRVGRSDRQAYAYLTWKPRKKLTPMAKERIAALRDFSALGSGYRVALRDLEIRGAGNLLGAEQSGVLAAVGYDLYCQMLEDAVKLVKGEYIEPEREIQIDLPLDAFLPSDYVPELNQRIELYRRLAAVRDWKIAEELREELLDRYGKVLPVPADNLFRLLKVKLICMETGISHIGSERGAIVLRLESDRTLSPQAVKKLQFEASSWRGRGLPAPAYTPERVTIFTHNVDQQTMLSMLEEVAGRLQNIEQEVLRAPRPLQPAKSVYRDLGARRFGR